MSLTHSKMISILEKDTKVFLISWASICPQFNKRNDVSAGYLMCGFLVRCSLDLPLYHSTKVAMQEEKKATGKFDPL